MQISLLKLCLQRIASDEDLYVASKAAAPHILEDLFRCIVEEYIMKNWTLYSVNEGEWVKSRNVSMLLLPRMEGRLQGCDPESNKIHDLTDHAPNAFDVLEFVRSNKVKGVWRASHFSAKEKGYQTREMDIQNAEDSQQIFAKVCMDLTYPYTPTSKLSLVCYKVTIKFSNPLVDASLRAFVIYYANRCSATYAKACLKYDADAPYSCLVVPTPNLKAIDSQIDLARCAKNDKEAMACLF